MPRHHAPGRKTPRTLRASRTNATAKMTRYRQRLRAAGLRPLQLWVPDTTAPGFRRTLRAQSLRASRHASADDAQEFLDAAFLELADE